MAYRETDLVRAMRAAQTARIIDSAITMIARGGLSAMTVRAIADHAGIATGLVFRYFPDMTELLVSVEKTLAQIDIDSMREAADKAGAEPVARLAAAILRLFSRMQKRESREMASLMHYPRAVGKEIERLIAEVDSAEDHNLVARATLGAICQLAAMSGLVGQRERTAVLFVLKGIGASPAEVRKAIELV